ncbi:hypothetical protein MSAN_02076300 [Mycena sanguinolenta]|uniref:DUF6534 domain-containing protein n=1 Tax=Mycena sanguinolenta TaxID=230812 RepID=A0A8H7CKD1_9AGAR|nr:hypothetical protein MSAN_02076300 [Mycena sanguinolenta]
MSDIPQTLGALLIGGLFATLFAGVVNLQTVFYWRTYQKDPLLLKVLIFTVWVLDNLHTSFIWAGLWSCLIQNYGLQDRVDYIPWCISLTVVITALVTFLVHCFFAHRIFMFSKKNWFMTSPILALTLLRLVAASIINTDLSLNRILDKLILYGLETGSLTCLGTIITMLLWVMTPKNLIFLGLHVVITKLYANSLLVTLNTRNHIQVGRLNGSSDQSKDLGPVIFLEHHVPKSPGTRLNGLSDKVPPINVQTQTSVRYDGDSIASSK